MPRLRVDIQEIDGALAILPSNSRAAVAVLAVANSGTELEPSAWGSDKGLVAAFGGGPGVDFGAFALQKYGTPVLFCRAHASVPSSFLNAVSPVAGSVGAITKTGTGTSVFTNDGSSVPSAAADAKVLFNVGGTRGTTGIVYQVSLDGGQSWGPPQALGTAVTFAAGVGVVIAIGAGTVVAGDFISFAVVAPIPASAGTVSDTGGGTATLTIDAAATCDDDYEAYILFSAGGTRGTIGIEYRWSLDGGRTLSAPTALGTATSITIPTSGGILIQIGAGTITAGRVLEFDSVAPQWNNTDLAAAITKLKQSSIPWECLVVIGPIDPTAAAVIDANIDTKRHWWTAATRNPVGAETYATYTASLSAAFASFATLHGSITAGDCEQISAVTGRSYRRPSLWPLAARQVSVDAVINIADPNAEPLSGCSVRDAKGNPKYYDEDVNPGLSDARFSTLRTYKEGFQGTRANLPLLFSPAGSDFDIVPKRRIMNLAHAIMIPFLTRRLAVAIFVDESTGYITATDRAEIESTGTQLLESGLAGLVSGARVTVSPNDNLLSGAPLTGRYRIIPPAWPQSAEFDSGFENPALNIQAV